MAELIPHFRAARRGLVLGAYLIPLALAAIALRGVAALWPRLASELRSSVVHHWSRGAARVLGVHVEVEGPPPTAPFVLVANHLSYIDIVILWAAAGGTFVAKSDVAHWPVLGPLGRLLNQVFIDRERKRDLIRVLAELEAEVARGVGVIFFPESTTSDGAGILPFKSSLFEVPARSQVPIACAALRYETPPDEVPARLSVCWWGDMTFGGHAWALLGLRRIDAHLRFGDSKILGRERKLLALESRDAVGGLFA